MARGIFCSAGRGRFALVIGVEKMTATPGKEVGDILLKASYQKEEADIPAGFAGVFGRIAEKYFQRYGDQSDALAAIAAKNHKNGVDNPYAQMRKDLGYDFCRTVSEKNPYVAPPLKRTDCSLVSDGAAALVLADEETARAMGKAVRFKAAVQVNDFLPISKRDITLFEGAAQAWARALDAADIKLTDLSFVESHDCFTIAELMEYEAMGLTAPGQGARAVLEGWTQKDGQAADQSLRRVEGEGSSDRRDRRLDACDHGDATDRPGPGRHAIAEGRPGRRVQHGRRGGRQLRLDPGAFALIPTSNLAHLLIQTARRFPDRPALIWRDTTWTWADFRSRVQAAAGALAAPRRRSRRPGSVARAQLQRRAGIHVRDLDDGRRLGADEFPPDPARGRLSRDVVRCVGAYLRQRVSGPRRRRAGGKPGLPAGDFDR